jgi:hypothetical protein
MPSFAEVVRIDENPYASEERPVVSLADSVVKDPLTWRGHWVRGTLFEKLMLARMVMECLRKDCSVERVRRIFSYGHG